MRGKGNLGLLLALGLAGAFHPTTRAYYGDGGNYEPKKSKDQLGNNFQKSKQGQKKFTYDDGFTCTALNKKSADKKHLRWLNSHPLTQ